MSGTGPERLRRSLAGQGLRADLPFARPELVAEALTHSSFASEQKLGPKVRHNERLEMLGDAVLGFLVADLLFDLLPEEAEGVLTRVRASLVDERSLAAKARLLELGAAMSLGKGEELTGGRTRDALLADAFEAVLAAIYRSEGLAAAASLVRALFADEVRERAKAAPQPSDYKTAFQERAQALWKLQPHYRIVHSAGPDHERLFVAEVFVGEQLAGQGEGRSKKLAEQEAAKAALRAWESLVAARQRAGSAVAGPGIGE